MYVHCNDCHHEWECTNEDDRKCEWCGGGSYILESESPLEKFNVNDVIVNLKKLNNPLANRIIRKLSEHPKK